MDRARVVAATVARHAAFEHVTDALDTWFIEYAFWLANVTSDGILNPSRLDLFVDRLDTDTIDSYTEAYQQAPDGVQDVLPAESSHADRVFARRDEFHDWAETADDIVLFRVTPDQLSKTVKLIDADDPTGTYPYGDHFSSWKLRSYISDALDDAPLDWTPKHEYDQATSYFQWAFDAEPTDVYLGDSALINEVTTDPLGVRLAHAVADRVQSARR